MQPITQSDENQRPMETNGHIQENGNNGKKATSTTTINNTHDASTTTTTIMKQNGTHTITDEQQKITLPIEMACMVPLKTLIGKMIRKAHADLMTLTDTLPSRGEVEKKRQILNYAILVRKQIIKLQVLVKWADNAEDIQMCQNIMAFLANQNQIFRDSTHFLHKIHAELPKARIRNFDILSAVDVLTTGSYQRMPTKFQSISTPLTDSDVLDTFSKINDVIRMRMMTTEVLPSPMKNYRIESGRIKFLIQNEFDVSLTLMGAPNERRWWIVALNVLVKSTAGNGAGDVDISLNEQQILNLRMNAQKQLVPPPPTHQQQQQQQQPGKSATPADNTSSSTPVYFPLVNLYDYLHLFCLNMQLEIIYMQAMMASRTRWLDQLRVFMDATRTKLTLIYWKGGSPAAQWARPQRDEGGGEKAVEAQGNNNSTVIEISISNETDKRKGPFTPQVNMAISIRDELKGLIEQAGLGASVELSKMDHADRPKIVSALKYPKNQLDVLWGGDSNLHTNADLLNPSDIDVERVLWHVTRHHSLCIIEKLRTVLKAQEAFLNENGLHLVEGRLEDVISDLETAATDDLKDQLYINEMKMDLPPVIVRYRHHRYININLDMRSGRIKVREAGYRLGEGDAKLKELEERLNSDPSNVSKHLLWLRSEVVIREIVSLAKQLSLQPFHTSQMSLRADDLVKLFGDVLSAPTTASQNTTITTDHSHSHAPAPGGGTVALNNNRLQYPSHCVFLQFAQFKDWYLVVTIVQNEVYSCLCCINEKRDANGLFQVIVDMMYMDYEAMWKEQFMPQLLESANSKKRRSHVDENDKEYEAGGDNEDNFHKKRRKTIKGRTDASEEPDTVQNVDNLSIDLRFMAKLDSLCRAFITNRKVELQLVLSSVSYMSRPLLKSLPTAESQVLNHPAANKMEVLCVPQRELLKACAARNVDDTHHAQHPGGVGKEIPLHVRPWVEKMTPRMKNDVLMRASGWWACGRNECFVVMQDKFDWKNIPLPIRDFNDHISLDRPSNVLSFTYTDIDSCINRFIIDWERIYMMANLARQSSSTWLEKYNEQLEFDNFNMQDLKFTYAKKFTCIIRWDSPNTGRARQYIVEVGMKDEYEKNTKKYDNNTSNESPTLLHLSVSRNPHWRVASFLQDILNDKRDVVYLIQVLFQTLPFMMSLEKLELHNTLKGSIGDVSIIPRAVDSVRIIYVSKHALDIWFTNHNTMCVSDAAFLHKLSSISSSSSSLRSENNNKSTPSQSSPAITNNNNNTNTSGEQQKSGDDTTDIVKPVKLSQDFQFTPFTEFDSLLGNVETWIFEDDNDDDKEREEISCFPLLSSMDESEPTAVPFKHGVICSASLCRTLISQLGSLKQQEEKS